jgi:signal transduction histidine kinase
MKGFDFKKNRILSVYQDEVHRRIFLGSITRGLYICSQQQFRCLKAGREEDEVYYAQAPFGEHSIVTPLGMVLDPITRTKTLAPLLSKIEFPDRYSITRDFNGNYWYKNHSELLKFNGDFTTVLWKQKIEDVINQLYIDKNGRLWVGMRKGGLYFLETAAASPQLQLYTAAVKDITYTTRGDQHVLWVATLKGLSRIDLSTRKIDTVPGLNNLYIRSLYAPSDEEVWITTYDHGVFLYKNGRLVKLPLDLKKYMETAHCILKDDQGYLWITTNNGLFQTSYRDALDFAAGRLKDLFYLYYGKEQGFNTNEFNGGCQPCALQLQNGDISLPSLDGLVYFTPAKIRTELPEKEIFIDQVELDAKIIDVKAAINLPNNFRNVRLSISTPYFGDPQNLHLYYSLEEEGKHDKELWLEMNSNRIIEFSSMHSGKYILRIRKLNGFGKNNRTEKVFTILVEKAFYETIWFRLLMGIAILLAGFAFSWLRVRRVESKNQILALRVTERTRELKETLDNLQLSEQQLRRQGFIQQRLIAAISHDLKTPLKYMMQVIGKGNEQRNGIGKDERNIIYDSLYSMFHLVENLIQYLKSQFMDDVSSLEMVDLGQLLEEKANIFRVVSRAKEITIINNTQLHTVVLVNRQLLAIVIHNLLDNAVKYTRKGSIQLETCCNEEEILIRFIDTGVGMSPAVINWIDQYRRGVPIMEGKPASHDGIGLIMVMELLQLINGDIRVSPNNDHGTVIDITLAVIR